MSFEHLLLTFVLVFSYSLMHGPAIVHADQHPGTTSFFEIVTKIASGVSSDSITFYHLTKCTSWWQTYSCLKLRETINRDTLCKRLTTKHNNNNTATIGTRISKDACVKALKTGGGYSLECWNAWAGKHCGKWFSDGGQTFNDNAQWNKAKKADADQLRQDVTFLLRPVTCTNKCRMGWNGSDKKVTNVIVFE